MSAVLIRFCLVLLHIWRSSEGLEITAGRRENITAKPGENVTLTCEVSDIHTVVLLEWSKNGSEPKNLLVIRDGRQFLSVQHESFKNRVFLLDDQMKDGDLSVVLKNVKMEDSGTYECRVVHENDLRGSLKLISSIHLSMVPPGKTGGQEGDKDGENNDDGTKKTERMSGGDIAGIIVGVLVLLLAAPGLFLIIKNRKNPRHHSPEPPNESKIPLRILNRNPEPED